MSTSSDVGSTTASVDTESTGSSNVAPEKGKDAPPNPSTTQSSLLKLRSELENQLGKLNRCAGENQWKWEVDGTERSWKARLKRNDRFKRSNHVGTIDVGIAAKSELKAYQGLLKEVLKQAEYARRFTNLIEDATEIKPKLIWDGRLERCKDGVHRARLSGYDDEAKAQLDESTKDILSAPLADERQALADLEVLCEDEFYQAEKRKNDAELKAKQRKKDAALRARLKWFTT